MYFCLYTLTAVTADILRYACDEIEARGSAHGTKYVEEFLSQNLSYIQITISFIQGYQASSVFLLIKYRVKI
jgi:hypothetical protein